MRISFSKLKFSDSNKKIYVKPQAGHDQVTTLGSNVILAWVCHVQGNHTIDRLEWWLRLYGVTNKSQIALMFYSPQTFWISLNQSGIKDGLYGQENRARENIICDSRCEDLRCPVVSNSLESYYSHKKTVL